MEIAIRESVLEVNFKKKMVKKIQQTTKSTK